MDPIDQDQTKLSSIRLEGGPTLLIGWRKSNNHLDARRVSLGAGSDEPLRTICVNALTNLASMDAVEYGPYAQPTAGEEFLTVAREDIVQEGSDPQDRGVDIMDLGSRLAEVPIIPAPELTQFNFNFYSIYFQSNVGIVGFTRHSNPRFALSKGFFLFKYSDRLQRVESPDIILDLDIDFMTTPELAFVLNPRSFDILTGDVQFATHNVPEHTKRVADLLKDKVALSDTSLSALRNAGGKKVSIARRIYRATRGFEHLMISPETTIKALQAHAIDPCTVIDTNGRFCFDESNVPVFLDLLEGRYYEPDFTNDHARADAFRKLPRKRA